MHPGHVGEEIRAFFSQHFPDRTLGLDEDIFDLGFGNSLFAMQLIEFIEARFAIEVEAEDLEMENFRTITAIAALVGRRRGNAELSTRPAA